MAGLVCFGKFDGETLSLAAAVHGNRVLVHSPTTATGDQTPARSISIRQAIVALTAGRCFRYMPIQLHLAQSAKSLASKLAGCLDRSQGRDLLFIGTSQAVQAYDVHHNADVFCRDVPEGVGCLMVGTCNHEMVPLLYVGSSLCVFGLDAVGKEQMWTVSSADVVVLASGDADDDGKSEILAGTTSADILVFKQVIFKPPPTPPAWCECSCGQLCLNFSRKQCDSVPNAQHDSMRLS